VARKIIIDCDPGQDDAVALLLAFASPEDVELLAITTVGGNVPLELTHRNARMMCDIAGQQDVPVFAGCAEPMRRPLMTAEAIHGETGINGIDVFEPDTPLQEEHAVDYIIRTLMGADDASVTLVPTGPLTNVATAIQKEPAILPRIEQIVLMGGAMREGGNRTPSAEFNILVDPEAADIVLRCGRPITQLGLDVTHQVLSTRDRVDRIRALGNPVAAATADMLSFFDRYDTKKYTSKGAPFDSLVVEARIIRG
jgi:purine nucleosidase